MKYLILSDIHANTPALDAVLAFVRRKRWDRTVVLGDVVGYGAEPNQAIETVRSQKRLAVVRGNHDKVCSGIESGDMFNRTALAAAQWTRRKLTATNLRWLRELPTGPLAVDGRFTICHGAPIDEDAYIFGEIDALNVFRQTTSEVCFFGHSHFPVVFGLSPDAITTTLTHGRASRHVMKPGVRYLINPGSVGQPRDGNPKASFAVFDSAKRIVTIYRVDYPVHKTRQRILAAGLPRALGDRLYLGR